MGVLILNRLPILALALAVGVGLSVYQLKSAEGLIIFIPVVVMAGSGGHRISATDKAG